MRLGVARQLSTHWAIGVNLVKNWGSSLLVSDNTNLGAPTVRAKHPDGLPPDAPRRRQAPPDLSGRCLRYPQRHMLRTILDTLREIVLAFYREPPGC